jgi:hypothetical protein
MNTQKAQSKSNGMIDKTAAGMHKTVDGLADAAASGAHQAVDKLVSATAPAASWVESRIRSIDTSRTKALENGKKYMQNYPLATLGAAVALGAIITLLARGRR